MGRAEQRKSHKKSHPQEKKVQITKGMSDEKANRIFVFLIFLFVIILYGNTYRNKYALDDHLVSYPNQQIAQGFSAIPDIFTTRYAVEEGLNYGYRPIVKTTFAIEYGIFKRWRPGVSHILNFLLYALSGYLLYCLLKHLFKDAKLLFPFLITLIFLAHPIHSEVVNSLKNRDEILSLLFSLAMLLSILRYIDTHKIYHIILGLIYFILAIFSKQSAGVFILVVPLVLYFYTDVKTRTILYLFVGGAIILIASLKLPSIFLDGIVRPTEYWENPLFTEERLGVKISTGLYILLYYLKLLILPYPLRFYYGFDVIPMVGPLNIWVILSFLFHAGIFIYAIYKIKNKNILSFVILLYLFSIAAYSNILFPTPGIVAERFVYPASIAFCIALIYLIYRIFSADPLSKEISKPSRSQIIIVVTLILIPFSIITIMRKERSKKQRSCSLFHQTYP